MQKEKEHIHNDGTIHAHAQSHSHTHKETKAVLNRLARIIGHMEAIKKMVESGRDCSEVLVQLSAVRSALDGVSKVILKDHIEHCIADVVSDNDREMIEKLTMAIDKLI